MRRRSTTLWVGVAPTVWPSSSASAAEPGELLEDADLARLRYSLHRAAELAARPGRRRRRRALARRARRGARRRARGDRDRRRGARGRRRRRGRAARLGVARRALQRPPRPASTEHDRDLGARASSDGPRRVHTPLAAAAARARRGLRSCSAGRSQGCGRSGSLGIGARSWPACPFRRPCRNDLRPGGVTSWTVKWQRGTTHEPRLRAEAGADVVLPTPTTPFRRRAWRCSSGRSTRSRRLGRCAGRGSEPRERLVAPEQLQALVEPGRDLRPRHGDADRRERLPRLQLQPLAELLQRRLDPLRGERLHLGERRLRPPTGCRCHLRRAAAVRLDRAEEEPREGRELAEAARSSPARAAPPLASAPRPSRFPARAARRGARLRRRPGRAPAGRRRSASRASGSRTWPGSRRPLEREPLDDLVAGS